VFLDRPSSAADVLSAANEVDVATNDVDGRAVAKTRWPGGDVDSVRRGDHGDGDEDGGGWRGDVPTDVRASIGPDTNRRKMQKQTVLVMSVILFRYPRVVSMDVPV